MPLTRPAAARAVKEPPGSFPPAPGDFAPHEEETARVEALDFRFLAS